MRVPQLDVVVRRGRVDRGRDSVRQLVGAGVVERDRNGTEYPAFAHDGVGVVAELDDAVAEHVLSQPTTADFLRRLDQLLELLLPAYVREGKSYLTIAFGCTGGRHRSVYTADRMKNALEKAGYAPTIIHRNLASRAADAIEGPQQ